MGPPVYQQPYQPKPLMDTIKPIVRGIGTLALVPLLVVLIVNVLILIWSPVVVLPETLDPVHGSLLFIIVPYSEPLFPLLELNGAPFAAYHLFLVMAIVASFLWMIYRSVGPFKQELAFKKPTKGHSPLYIIGTIFFAILAFDAIYAIVLYFLGIEITTPDFGSRQIWQLLNGLASASVWEELVVRVLYLGIPLLLIALVIGKKRPWWRYVFGGGFPIGGKELVLIWASAGIFALGHVVYWDLWKIVPTWVAGIAFGYLFLKLGLYACVMLHFTVNYLTMPLDITQSLAIGVILGLVIIAWEFIGGVYLISYINKLIRFLTGADLQPRPRPAPMPAYPMPTGLGSQYQGSVGPGPGSTQPNDEQTRNQIQTVPATGDGIAPSARSPGFFVCPRCGNTEARYKDGKLECTRCGLVK